MIFRPIFLIIFSFLFFLLSCSENTKNTQNETQKENIVSQPVQIFALGDSLTAGYGLELEEAYPAQLAKKLTDAGYTYKVING